MELVANGTARFQIWVNRFSRRAKRLRFLNVVRWPIEAFFDWLQDIRPVVHCSSTLVVDGETYGPCQFPSLSVGEVHQRFANFPAPFDDCSLADLEAIELVSGARSLVYESILTGHYVRN